MIETAWRWFTLDPFPLARWQRASLLHRAVGLFGSWRTSSWLLQWAEALGVILMAIVLGFAPFAETSLVGVLLIACGGYWLLLTLADHQASRITPIHWGVMVYWSLMAIATAFSPEKKIALAGLIKFSLFLFMFFLGAEVLRSPRWRNWLVTIYLHISLVVAGYGIRQEFFGVDQLATWNDPTSALANDTRVYSYLGNPNLLSSYLIPAIALSIGAIFVWQGWLPKLLALTTFGINVACLFFTDSRGGWIATVMMLAVFFLLLRAWFAPLMPRFWRRWLLPMVFGSFGGMMFAAILAVEKVRLRFMSIFAGRGDSSNNYRMNVWEAVWEMVHSQPKFSLFGIGPGNGVFKRIYPLYAETGYENALGAYSIFLEHIAEIGWLGFAGFLWLIILVMSYGVRVLVQLRDRRDLQAFWLMAAIAGGTGLLAQGLFDTVWYRPAVNTLWWWLVAIVASFSLKETASSGVRLPSSLPDPSEASTVIEV
ncbi:MAG: putative bicarbonate transporter, IctB family [Spirulina sp. SIO3F2]|nr:putative bicarbonate transporter, IctB family [Spirulina sp. SIO3F2]